MSKLELPLDFNTAETVLFLGSGFSRGAVAVNGKELPLGGQLDDRLSALLDLPLRKYQGKTLAQLAGKKDATKLKAFLDENLTVKTAKSYHTDIVQKNGFVSTQQTSIISSRVRASSVHTVLQF